MTPLFFGLDASSFQGMWDPTAEHAAGLAFGLEKATQGVGYTNPDYTAMVTRMRSAGLVPGGYHFLDGSGSGAAQADHYVATLAGDTRVMLALDVEALGQISRAHVVDWCVEVNRLLPHRDLVIYTGQSFWAQITGGLDIRALEQRLGVRIFLWDAGDGHRPNIYVPGSGTVAAIYARVSLAGWQPYGGWDTTSRLFLQFTDKAGEPGVAGGVDGDVFFGPITQLQALTGAAPSPVHHSQEDTMLVHADTSSAGGEVGATGLYLTVGRSRYPVVSTAITNAAQRAGYGVLGLTGDLILAQWPVLGDPVSAPASVDVAALATALAPYLTQVDVQALAADLAAVLAPGEQAAAEAAMKAIFAKAAA